MTRLSVNVNKLATLRNSREKNNPDVAALSRKILTYGAHGLTVHPRPDGRHIRRADVATLYALVQEWNHSSTQPVEYNIEGYPSPDYLQLLREFKPDQATLVPDPPEALTSNAGWNVHGQSHFLKPILQELKSQGIRVSLFVDPYEFNETQLKALIHVGADRIELYTEKFADAYLTTEKAAVTARYVEVARQVADHGMAVNAGHDLNQENLRYLLENVPQIEEVSIGHALICEALEQGLELTVKNYLKLVAHGHSYARSSQR